MKKVICIFIALISVIFVANASSVEETYVCTVYGWNNADGKELKINIYLRELQYSDPCYVGRDVNERGEVSSLSAPVKFVTSSTYSSNFRYFVKLGLVGSYYFNTNKLNEEYVGGNPDLIEKETYVCTVYGWNNFDGKKQKINVYLYQSKYGGTYYVGRDVDKNGLISTISGVVKLVTNPEYRGYYTYYVKTGMVGAYFFNTRSLNRDYVRQ